MKRKDGRDTETRDRNKEERDTPIQEGFLEKRKKAYIQRNVSPSFFFFFFFFGLFRATPMARGGSQAWGQVRTVAAGLRHSHSNATSELHLQYHSSGQRRILNPLSEARDRTCVLMDTSQTHSC